MDPLILMVAPNGARRSKADHPNLPMTPGELAVEAERCSAAGATVIHLHVRTADGRHSLDPELYRSAIHAVRMAVGERMAIQVTTESVGLYTPEAQIAVVRELRPEAVSLALRELIPDEAHIHQAADFLHWLPGVRRHPDVAGAFIIDRRIARWEALQFFHLLGFRRRGAAERYLIMARRRQGPS